MDCQLKSHFQIKCKLNTISENTGKLNKENDFDSPLSFCTLDSNFSKKTSVSQRHVRVTTKNTTQKVACLLQTMVKLFLRIHLGCSEECQILVNSTTQQLKAFRETGKNVSPYKFSASSFTLFLFSLLAQKVFKHQSFEFDTDAPMTTYKKKSCKKDKYTHARKQW